jgi:hypothetical protein
VLNIGHTAAISSGTMILFDYIRRLSVNAQYYT